MAHSSRLAASAESALVGLDVVDVLPKLGARPPRRLRTSRIAELISHKTSDSDERGAVRRRR